MILGFFKCFNFSFVSDVVLLMLALRTLIFFALRKIQKNEFLLMLMYSCIV